MIARDILQRWFARAGRAGRAGAPAAAPLLPPTECRAFVARLPPRGGSTLPGHREVTHRSFGEQASRFRGSGLEYEDSRPYRAGDDPRLLDWRLSARAGLPFVRVHREERRPLRFLLVDRRPGMCFATRGRLKAAQAALAAVLLGAAAVRDGADLGAVTLERRPVWLPPQRGPRAFQAIARAAGAPCQGGTSDVSLPTLLGQVAAFLPAGSELFVFSDLDTARDAGPGPWLRLVAEHEVRVVEILDPAELDLPAAGTRWLEPPEGGPALPVDTGDATLRAAFRERAATERAARRAPLAAAGIPLRPLGTRQDPVAALRDWLGG